MARKTTHFLNEDALQAIEDVLAPALEGPVSEKKYSRNIQKAIRLAKRQLSAAPASIYRNFKILAKLNAFNDTNTRFDALVAANLFFQHVNQNYSKNTRQFVNASLNETSDFSFNDINSKAVERENKKSFRKAVKKFTKAELYIILDNFLGTDHEEDFFEAILAPSNLHGDIKRIFRKRLDELGVDYLQRFKDIQAHRFKVFTPDSISEVLSLDTVPRIITEELLPEGTAQPSGVIVFGRAAARKDEPATQERANLILKALQEDGFTKQDLVLITDKKFNTA